MEPKPVKKITLWVLTIWTFSLLFMLSGLGQLAKTPLAGIFTFLAGLSFFPPFIDFLRNKLRIEMSKVVRVVVFVVLVILGGVALGPTNTEPAKETPKPSAAPQEQTKVEAPTAPVASPTPNAEVLAGSVYTNAFLNDVYPLMISANEKISKGGSAGASYDFATAKTEISAGISDYKKAQANLKAIKSVPPALTHINGLITSALAKYIEGAQTVLTGVEKYDADLISKGNDIYKEGTTLINQATEEMKAYTASLSK